MGKANSRDIVMVVALTVLVGVFHISSGGLLLHPLNLTNFFMQNAFLLILAPAVFFVMVTGRLDLSVGSVAAFAGAVSAYLMIDRSVPVVFAVPIVLCLGALIGVFHGYVIGYLRVPMFVTTLAGMLIWRGLTLVLLDGETKTLFPREFLTLINGYIPVPALRRGVPFILLIILFTYGIYRFAAERTTFGRRVYATGGNPEAARLSGVSIRRTLLAVYAISGLAAGLAGIIVAARLNAATPKAGNLFEFDAITACLLGGVSMVGGVGRIRGVLLGALLLGVINNGISLSGSGGDLVLKAGLLLGAGLLDAYQHRHS